MHADYPTIYLGNEKMLLALLEQNRQNKMAFEYLMGWYMLTKQLGKLVENMKRLDDFGYVGIPQLYEEAALIYVYGTGKPLYLGDHEVRPESRERIEQFSTIFNRYQRDKRAAFRELAALYGDSYYFYHLYGFSGVKG